MNCKQGDLVIYVGRRTEFQGHVGRCVSRVDCPITGEPGWRVDPPLFAGVKPDLRYAALTNNGAVILDRSLRPIENPGDDAQDETLSWLPVPHKETA